MKAGSEDFANIWFPNIWGEHQMGTALNQPSKGSHREGKVKFF